MTLTAETTEKPETDIEIARSVEMKPIEKIAEKLGLREEDLEKHGDYKAKVDPNSVRSWEGDGKLILVTAMTPTPHGEGKTVTTIGLGQAFDRIGESNVVAVREPSMGPTFGIKGGAAGGGWSQVLPMEDINLHFTGDMHAVTTAHNLLAAMVDNHIAKGNELDIDVRRVEWKRAMDMNDRTLREIVVGLGDEKNGVPREDSFEITAASEIMDVLCLAENTSDLKDRLRKIVVAYDTDGKPVTSGNLNAADAMTILLKDAVKPNLVQTTEHTPALVHGGPFGNIAHGTNSVIADKLGLKLADYLITEAGFGSDLGAEKFFNIVSRQGLEPDAVVLVATVRALKHHGNAEDPEKEDVDAVKRGLENLDKHIENVQMFGLPVVVAVNRFADDTEKEIEAVLDHCKDMGVDAELSNVYAEGGEGGVELARKAIELAEKDNSFEPLYDVDDSTKEKIEVVAKEVYGAKDVKYTSEAESDIERIEKMGFGNLPVCIAKEAGSLTDDASKKGAPRDWKLKVRELEASPGAGFIVVYTGDILTMPGLPKTPAAEEMEIDDDGKIKGLE